MSQGRSGTGEVVVGANPADRARNRALGAGLVDDPYPLYDRLRDSGPVQEGSISGQFGVPGADSLTWADRPQFSCYSWGTVDAVLRDNDTFSSRWYEPTLEPTVGRSILQMDEPEHRRYRGLVQPAFTRKEMERWEERWVRPVVERLVGGFRESGRVDLYAEYCAKIPVHTIASSFGVAEDDVSEFHELAVTVVGSTTDIAERMRASNVIAEYLRRIIADRRAKPRDDLISVLTEVELEDEDGRRQRLSDEEILAFARIMLPAGAGTTYRGLGCLLLALLRAPDQLEAIRSDRSLVPQAIEEGLRWEQPLTALSRLVTRDTELGDVKIPEGAVIHACLGAANHDPARWENPHAFDIHRAPKPHATFGSGPHLCIGMHLARMELRTGLGAVLDGLPKLRLDPEAEEPWITGLLFRMPTAVPVVCG